MSKEAEYGYKVRLLRIMRALLEQPKRYAKRELREKYGVGKDAIDNDFQAFKSAGFVLRYDERFRYYFVEDKPLKQLKDLLHFSEEDQILLTRAIDKVAETEKYGEHLKSKLASLYDYHRLGYAYLRKPYLAKIDKLLTAKEDNRQVILKQYHSSNSNSITDRHIEPYHIDPPKDTLQAFDLDKKEIRHFRISRITRIQMTTEAWKYKYRHRLQAVDPFRIMDNQKVMVHLRLRVGAYNELIERFPLTKAHILPAEEEGVYDFQCEVNHEFYGLSNFILGTHNLVEVLSPDRLLLHLQAEVKKMQKKWLV